MYHVAVETFSSPIEREEFNCDLLDLSKIFHLADGDDRCHRDENTD